jgi:hypothetical protein
VRVKWVVTPGIPGSGSRPAVGPCCCPTTRTPALLTHHEEEQRVSKAKQYRRKPERKVVQPERQSYYGDYRPARHCVCGKSGWTDRADARAVLRQMRRRAEKPERLDIYRCTFDDTHYHIGNWRGERDANLNDPAAWAAHPPGEED